MATTRMRRLLVPWAFLLVLAPAVAFAQTGAASITGLITDETGATLPGVTVTATNQGTNVPYTAVSNGAGSYTITSVPVGTYVIKVELSGFRTSATKPVVLEAKQVARLDFKMGVGAIAETVDVVGSSPILQTETVTVGEVISGNTATALPLNGRNSSQLALLLPGAMTVNPAGFTNVPGAGTSRPFVNGNREQVNSYTLDGLDVNETIDNGVGYQPSPDAVAEVSVETNNYQADTGNVGGAVISAVLKSGTNRFTGNAFEFYRNSDLDANSWANNRSGAPKPERRQDIYGGTFGGPLIKDRLFFFGNYQGSRQDAPGSATASVAPEAWRRGDLSSIATPVIDPLTGLQFPGNIIPASRISAVARALFSNTANYPLPNAAVAGVTGNYVGKALTEIRARQGDVRMDWNASQNDKFFGRVSLKTYKSNATQQAFPLLLGTFDDRPFWNVGFNWNRIFGSAIVNEALVGFSSTTVTGGINDWAGIGNANASYGIAGGQPIPGLSSIGWGSGLTAPGNIATANSDTLANTFQINEKLTWLKARHAMKFGGQWLSYNQRRFYAGNNGMLGFINYNGAFTGFAFSDFLLDMASSKGRGGGDPADPWTHLQNRVGVFAQDDFKVRPNITLNLGLRWAYTSPLVEKDNRQTNFDLKTGLQTFAKDGSTEDRALYKPFYNGWEPRLGAAWKITDRLVARGGYGISQFMEGTGANLRLPLNPPFFFESSVNYDRTTGAGNASSGFADLVPGTTPTGNVRAYDPNLRPQFTQQYNVFVEYQLSSSMSAQAGYVGNRATHLVAPVEGNQALPGVGDPTTWASKTVRRPLYAAQPLITTIATTASRAHSEYNSLQTSVRRRNVNGLEFMASYTLSDAKSNNRGYYGGGGVVASEGAYWANTYDPDADWGPAFFDVRHNLIFSASYELPFGKDRAYGADWNALTDAVLGGWRVGGILQARTGIPVTVVDGRARSLQGERGSERPNCVGDWKPSDQSITKWLDINGFAAVPLGTFGNCPVGVARAPGYTNLDFVLGKRFAIGGSRYFEFRVETFNLLNHPSFGPPARDISAPNTFGLITTTVSSPRVIELAFKFNF